MTRSDTALALLVAGLLAGCQQDTAALTLVNAGPGPVEVEGLQQGAVVVDAGESTRIKSLEGTLRLTARRAHGVPTEQTISLQPGGEAIWRLAGESCFVEGDFSAYYTTATDRPAAVRVVGIMGPEQAVYRSQGMRTIPAGHALPRTQRTQPVHALVQIPCSATESTALAQAWLEMILDEIEPK